MKKTLYILTIIYLMFMWFFILIGRIDICRLRALNVISGSMESTIKTGETIIIYKDTKYKVGDIITFISNNSYVTHRIIEINDNEVTTKGDANNTNDESINTDSIIGKVILIIPTYYGTFGKFLGIILIILIICQEIKRKEEKNE